MELFDGTLLQYRLSRLVGFSEGPGHGLGDLRTRAMLCFSSMPHMMLITDLLQKGKHQTRQNQIQKERSTSTIFLRRRARRVAANL